VKQGAFEEMCIGVGREGWGWVGRERKGAVLFGRLNRRRQIDLCPRPRRERRERERVREGENENGREREK